MDVLISVGPSTEDVKGERPCFTLRKIVFAYEGTRYNDGLRLEVPVPFQAEARDNSALFTF